MFLAAVLILVCLPYFSHAQSQACMDGIQDCTNAYVSNVFSGNMNEASVCRELNTLIRCIYDLPCDLPEEAKKTIIDNSKAELAKQGFNCELDIENAVTRGPYTTIAPEFTTKPKTCASAVSVCTQKYINEVFERAKTSGGDTSWLCGSVQTYVNCMVYSPCKLEEVRNVIETKVEEELKSKGISCDISVGGGQGKTAPTIIGVFIAFTFALVLNFAH